MDDDPFAALVQELNLDTNEEQNTNPEKPSTSQPLEVKASEPLNNENEAPIIKAEPPSVEQKIVPKSVKKEQDYQTTDKVETKTAAVLQPKPTPKPKEKPKEKEKPKPKPKPIAQAEPKPKAKSNAQNDITTMNGNVHENVDNQVDVDDDDDDDEDVLQELDAINDIAQMKEMFVSYQKERDKEMYDLKSKFTDISRRQKEVFVEVESRRKTALAKGKKYKQTAQQLQYQITKLQNDLGYERKKRQEMENEMTVISEQKKQREQVCDELQNTVNVLQSSLNNAEMSKDQILDEMKETNNVIDKLFEVEKIQEKLRCYIDCDKNASNGHKATLRFHDSSIDLSKINIQWNRSHFLQFISIKNACSTEYALSADDIGSVIKVEVRSKENPDCVESTTLSSSPIKLNSNSLRNVEAHLGKISKKEIEFDIIPDLSDEKTGKFFAPHLKSAKSQTLILHFNRDKVKIRNHKNNTIEKEQYNSSMRVILLAADQSNRFSFRLKNQKTFVFQAKTIEERDDIAILLRCYLMKMSAGEQTTLNRRLHLRYANEKANDEELGMTATIGDTLTRDQLVSKILAPISSNPRLHSSLHNFRNDSVNSTHSMHSPQSTQSVSAASISGMLQAPNTNKGGTEPSYTNESNDFNVDALFPDFNSQHGDKNANEEKKNANNDDDDDARFGVDQFEEDRKAYVGLQFQETESIATDAELKKHAAFGMPKGSKNAKSKRSKKGKSKTKTKGKGKGKAKKVKNEKAAKLEKAETNGNGAKPEKVEGNSQIGLTANFSDRLDCLLNPSGEVMKYQVVGSLTLIYNQSIDSDVEFYASVGNLEHAKTKIFSPMSTKTLDTINGKIAIKLSKNEKNVGVLKYVWATKEIAKDLPFFVSLQSEHTEEDGGTLSVVCTVKPNEHFGSMSMKELSIVGTLKDAPTDCTDHSKVNGTDFMWNKDTPNKFVWSMANQNVDKTYKLSSTFKSGADNKVNLKIQFEIENLGISNITIENLNDPKYDNQNIAITKQTKNIRSGEFIVR